MSTDTGTRYILVTGSNGGLGLGICERLIDEFLTTQPSNISLTLLFTTRSSSKGNEVLRALQTHLTKHHGKTQQNRIKLQPENVDLTNLISVRTLARKLVDSDIPQLDALILNAGVGGWSGLNWFMAVRTILYDIRTYTTWPHFKLGIVGLLTPKQLPEEIQSKKEAKEDEPPLGQIFCANVFGHYMLVHWLMPLIRACEATRPSRIIWLSSIEPQARHFNEEDIQCLESSSAYEGTKRLVDVLALTYNQTTKSSFNSTYLEPSPSPLASDPSSGSSSSATKRKIKSIPSMHTTHPGILATPIIDLPWIIFQAYWLGILLARIVGGVWSTVTPYPAAHATTWLALSSPEEISNQESTFGNNGGRVKWGTSSSPLGTTTVRPTEVEGWGINGSGTSFVENWWAGKLGRAPNAVEAKGENVEDFRELGGRLWRFMEELRVEWSGRIDEV